VHVRQAEAAPDQATVAEHLSDLFRARVRRDVEVFRFAPQEQVADTTADQMGLKTGRLEPIQNLQRIGRDIGTRDRVLVARNDNWAGDRRLPLKLK
jgi:hypothetical protein